MKPRLQEGPFIGRLRGTAGTVDTGFTEARTPTLKMETTTGIRLARPRSVLPHSSFIMTAKITLL